MRDTIVIGASAGGIDAICRMLSQLPADLPAVILVALHISPTFDSVLPTILTRCGKLRADAPSPGVGERLAGGRIHVVRPDHHLAIVGSEARAVLGPRINGHRPAIDVLFRSSARVRGDRVIGILLTGMLDDGVGGLREIREHGGVAVVQDPNDAAYPELPSNALAGAGADHVVRVADMGPLILKLLDGPTPGGGGASPGKGDEGMEGVTMPDRALGPTQDWSPSTESPEGGAPSVYSCPECGGVLWNRGPDDVPRFVCRTGHAYDPESLLSEQSIAAEQAMWASLRALEERLSLTRKLEARARVLGDRTAESRLAQKAAEAEPLAQEIRHMLSGPAGRKPKA